MNRRSPSAFAVGAALLVVLAGMGVLSGGDTTNTADVDLLPGVDDSQLTREDSASPTSVAAPSAPSLQYELYRALTYVSTNPSKAVRSRADRTPEEAQDSDQRLHRWHCPICDATKLSLGAPTGDPVEEAANNLRSHLRNSDGDGHGPPGTLPPGVTPELIHDSVVVSALAE